MQAGEGSIVSREYWVMAALAIASIVLVTVFGRADKPRESLFLFLLSQAVTWPITILIALAGWGESPVRLFPKATDSNFVIAFVFLPAAFVAYYWHYPQSKGRPFQIAYTLAFAGGVSLAHVAVQKYTNLMVYIDFSGYKLWLMTIVAYYLQRIYSDWYFDRLAQQKCDDTR